MRGVEPVHENSSRCGSRDSSAPLDRVEQGPVADHLPQGAADGGDARQVEQFAGAVVDEEDALVGVERDDALDHAAEDGPQLLAVLLERGDALRRAFRSCG